MPTLVPVEIIEQRIFLIRGEKVMIDRDQAELYRVGTKVLNRAVRRSKDRFPNNLMFQPTKAERDEVVTIGDHLSS
jgi:hypothetical protein